MCLNIGIVGGVIITGVVIIVFISAVLSIINRSFIIIWEDGMKYVYVLAFGLMFINGIIWISEVDFISLNNLFTIK